MKSLGSAVSKVAAPALGRRGFGEALVILQWAAIVGPGLARETLPVKLSFGRGERVDGTLQLRVTPGAALEVQHLEPVLLERINGFFGYRAVARISLRQGPLPTAERRGPPPSRPLDARETASLARRVGEIADPNLREALEGLGRAVLASPAAGRLQRR